DGGRRAGRRAGAVAGIAGVGLDHGHLQRHAAQGVDARPPHLHRATAAAGRALLSRPAAGAAVEQAAEQVAEVEAGGVAEVEAALEAVARRLAGPERLAEGVVLLALVGIGQHVVRLGRLLEPRLRCVVAGVAVRVVLAGQLAVRLLDLVVGRPLADAQRLVMAPAGHYSWSQGTPDTHTEGGGADAR